MARSKLNVLVNKYAKFVVSASTAVVAVAVVLSDADLSTRDGVVATVIAVGAVLVRQIPNRDVA